MVDRTTVIEGGTVVAFDGKEHRIVENGFVLFSGDRIVEIGRNFSAEAGNRISAKGKLVIPGLISLHAHAGVDAGSRVIVDGGRRDLWRSGFFNFEPINGSNSRSFGRSADTNAGLRYGLACLLKGGVTTAVELGGGDGGFDQRMVELADEAGIRLYYGPTFYSGYYAFDPAGRFELRPDDRQAEEALDRAVEFIERFDGANDGRFRGMLIPSSFLRTPQNLFRRVKEAAASLGVGITFHITESLWEFQRTVDEHAKTPISVVADWGVLGPEVILGHTIYVSGHSQTAWPYEGDLQAISQSGATVAHSPVTFARRGVAMESFQRYLDHGINLGIGTDTYPLDILEEMRIAAIAGKLADSNFESARAADVFNAATLGGARALGTRRYRTPRAGCQGRHHPDRHGEPSHEPIRGPDPGACLLRYRRTRSYGGGRRPDCR